MSAASDRAAARAAVDALTHRSEALIDRIERDTTEEQRNWRPAPEDWSMVEVVQHVALAAGGILRTAHPTSGGVRWTGAVRLALLTRVLRSRVKLRAPVSAIVPRPGVTWEEARGRMSGAVARWQEFVESDSFGTTAFRHPLTGRHTAAQTARFVVEHLDHHVRQIDRLFVAHRAYGPKLQNSP